MGELADVACEINRELARKGLTAKSVQPLVDFLAEQLVKAGVPLLRLNLTHERLRSDIMVSDYGWWRGGERNISADWARVMPQEDELASYPFYHMYLEKLEEWRVDLTDRRMHNRFPLFGALHELGCTDYMAFTVLYVPRMFGKDDDEGGINSFHISYVADRKGGMSDSDIELLRAVTPSFGLAVKAVILADSLESVALTYLGTHAGSRVLKGQIGHGDKVDLEAVIWFSDLRASTRWAQTLSPDGFLALLNDYFAATSGAVIDGGGQILRYYGDATLAIFPIGEGEDARGAVAKALAAVREADRRVAALNRKRHEKGEEPVGYGIGLHVGEMIYGNIGVPQRQDFTIIGTAANLASRVEGQCKRLSRRVVVTGAVAALHDGPWENLGPHQLDGVAEPVPLFAPGWSLAAH